jgi:hypothetical protein
MKILPDGAAYGTWNANIVFQPGPAALNRLWNQIGNYGTTFDG